MSSPYERRLPIGAEPLPQGGTHFRVWAHAAPARKVVLVDGGAAERAESQGYFSGRVEPARTGSQYRFRLDRASDLYPDPGLAFPAGGAARSVPDRRSRLLSLDG